METPLQLYQPSEIQKEFMNKLRELVVGYQNKIEATVLIGIISHLVGRLTYMSNVPIDLNIEMAVKNIMQGHRDMHEDLNDVGGHA